MTQDLPEISYERSMNHNYMVLSKCDFFEKEKSNNTDYRTRMLLENTIPGLLPVTHRLVNGESRYYYEINSLQSLDRLYEKNEIQYVELKKLLSGCINLFDKLDEYLLDGTQIIIKSELIYINVEKMQPYFVCYPDYEGDVRIAFMEFIDELLTKIDHTDERAVMLSYQVYRYTRNPNYVISEIGNLMKQMEVNVEDISMSSNCFDSNVLKNKVSENHNKIAKHNKYIENFKPNIDTNMNGTDFDIKEQDRTKQNIFDKSTIEYKEDILYQDTEHTDVETMTDTKQKNRSYLLGGICSIGIALCTAGIIIEEKIFRILCLSENSELYLFGGTAMAIVTSVLFFSCYLKKVKQNKDIESLNDDNDNNNEYAMGEELWEETRNENKSLRECKNKKEHIQESYKSANRNDKKEKQTKTVQQSHATFNETVCLGDGIVEERILYGRIKGEEVSISLNKLPVTVGTLENVADIILNDTTVSKMHVRFEEQGGRVYICDLNSTNGTVRNGVLLDINQRVMLEPGDKIRIGRTNFTYC